MPSTNRYLDTLARLMSLHTLRGDLPQALETGERLHTETARLRGSDWPGLGQIDAYLHRVRDDLG